MDALSLWVREVSPARPAPRLWSLTSGSLKCSSGDTGLGGGLSSAVLSCESWHLHVIVFCLVSRVCMRVWVCEYSLHVFSLPLYKKPPFSQKLARPCDMYQSHMSQLAASHSHRQHDKHCARGHCPCVALHTVSLWKDAMQLVPSPAASSPW